ncbi:MAG: hypothetical protein A3K60_00885 [Euryarchaeota archaeon RBG_19FT_COMBO_56_21]|nr:MAG: hypothetical protein A3K60_00885 [Euryarchaeota archaeon RBG_19FT_COMBO_56_21]
MPGRVTIGLYNSYDPVRFHESHRRALARAGPLALAFNCNLATFGFPYEKELSTPVEIANWVSTTTSIGESGAYLVELANKGRFSAFDFPKKGFPPQLGEVVVTTRKPSSERKASLSDVRSALKSGRSVLLVFGLGPRGLPKEVFEIGQKHLDVTAKGLSLETCTALGAVVGALLAK